MYTKEQFESLKEVIFPKVLVMGIKNEESFIDNIEEIMFSEIYNERID